MGIDYTAFVTLNDSPVIKDVFKNILRNRRVSRYQLVELGQTGNKTEEVNNALVSLEKNGLIGKVTGQSEEKDLFYPSGSGLIAEKFIK